MKAVFNAILVKPHPSGEKMHGGIIVPDLGKEKNISGTIISVGPGHYSVTGEFIKTTLTEGMEVILPQMGPVVVEIDGEDFYVCAENTVLAVI